ncbi:hypothetical protein QT381_07480 [Galbitalea sp. SE-J8]|uniref:OmpL47-type beta-barrel domain-containing protein n=1 Tax=Galbitalea sp. SE-J8 TaxID=3054952 RepID=UPI00259CC940|nr:hypothetical protein [Galbitalea sp. SE-J8]MDM4762846.1 hypothetical protein [Galbitalea sp. SE-J8]
MSPALAADPEPDFGPNVVIFTPDQSVDDINAALAAASNESEFSMNRHAFLFSPGVYGSAAGAADPSTATGIINAQVGYYTQIAGLGSSPDDVVINGAIHAEGRPPATSCPWDGGGEADTALTNFWRSMSNLAINPIQRPVPGDTGVAGVCYPSESDPDGIMEPEGTTDPNTLRWAVSQASPLRRVHVAGSLTLMPRFGGYSSGGYLGDSVVDDALTFGSQQQWFTRDSSIGSSDNGVWNEVFSGVEGARATDFGQPVTGGTGRITTVGSTDVSRSAPFLTVDGTGAYSVFAPALRTGARGADWSADGRSIPIDEFYLAHPGDTAATINHALAIGKNLLVTPGVYSLDAPIRVTEPNTVVLGLGMATLVPTAGTSAITVDDVSGVQLSGLTIDAGAVTSPNLVQIGEVGSAASHATNPTTLTDMFVRIGGPHAGRASVSFEINSDHVILDDIWAWRADHGTGVGWAQNTADTGVVVNGDDVTALGLFVEHYQKNQVIWNGERGRTVFYQSEIPYDVPDQASWNDGDRAGYASYRVADSVTDHRAIGLGVYSFFNEGVDIFAESGVQAPVSRRVRFQSISSVLLNGDGGIRHIVNDQGAAATVSGAAQQLIAYAPVDTTAPTATITASKPAPDGPNGWYRGVTVTPGATDDFRPAPSVRYRLDGGAWTASSAPIVLSDGEHTLDVRATDDSGNDSAIVSWSGRVDGTAPQVTASVSGANTASAAVSVSATDATSGLASIEYAVGSGAWTAYSGPVAVPAGSAVVSFRATDAAGNVSSVGSAAATGVTITPSPVAVSGTPKVGSTLTARTGSWGTATVTLAYQWLRGGKPIAGAVGASYRLKAADAGRSISVRVTGTAAGLPAASVVSPAVTLLKALPRTPKPKIAGTAKVGKKLTVKTGSWGAKVTLSYRWYRNGVAIAKATRAGYTLTKADRHRKLTVTVTGKRLGYATASRTSASKRVR